MVQGVSKEKYSRLPNIASTARVKPRIVCHRDCNRDSDAQMECEGMSQQERPREDRREAKARDLSNAWRPSQSKDTLDTRPLETTTSRTAGEGDDAQSNAKDRRGSIPHLAQNSEDPTIQQFGREHA